MIVWVSDKVVWSKTSRHFKKIQNSCKFNIEKGLKRNGKQEEKEKMVIVRLEFIREREKWRWEKDKENTK